MAESTQELLDLPNTEFSALLKAEGKWKDRSQKTHEDVHRPLIERLRNEMEAEATKDSDGPNSQLPYVLLGHSFIERLKPGPNGDGSKTTLAQLPERESFNAGVGGDKISSVIYRAEELGLLHGLESLNVQVWYLRIGTNDICVRSNGQAGPLGSREVNAIRLLIIALLRTSPTSRVVFPALTYRNDSDKVDTNSVIDQSNGACYEMITTLQKDLETMKFGEERLTWLPAHSWFNKKRHLKDHVHLTEEAYMLEDETLWPEVRRVSELGPGPAVRYGKSG